MKTLLYALLIIGGVVLIAYALAAAVGMLMYIGVAIIILSILGAIVQYAIDRHKEHKEPRRKHARATKSAERALKEMERTINKQ